MSNYQVRKLNSARKKSFMKKQDNLKNCTENQLLLCTIILFNKLFLCASPIFHNPFWNTFENEKRWFRFMIGFVWFGHSHYKCVINSAIYTYWCKFIEEQISIYTIKRFFKVYESKICILTKSFTISKKTDWYFWILLFRLFE